MEEVDTKVGKLEKDGGVRMKGIPQGRYTKEFREEAVKMIMEAGMSLPVVARLLIVDAVELSNWVKAYKAGNLKEIGKNYRRLTEIVMELARVKRELIETRMERDLLKKAAAYFARETQPGPRWRNTQNPFPSRRL